MSLSYLGCRLPHGPLPSLPSQEDARQEVAPHVLGKFQRGHRSRGCLRRIRLMTWRRCRWHVLTLNVSRVGGLLFQELSASRALGFLLCLMAYSSTQLVIVGHKRADRRTDRQIDGSPRRGRSRPYSARCDKKVWDMGWMREEGRGEVAPSFLACPPVRLPLLLLLRHFGCHRRCQRVTRWHGTNSSPESRE